jgi:tRNA (mo5U34)-methyltransferase
MLDHKEIGWFHTIDVGNGVITQGVKSAELLKAEFDAFGFTDQFLRGRRLLDIGCNDGYMSLQCARLGADVTAIDGVYRDSLKYVRKHAETKFRFYCLDFLSPSFFELGRFDIILYLGVLYHTMYPFEHIQRLANASAAGATVLIDTEFYNLPGFEDAATVFYDYGQTLTPDPCSPVFPSVSWLRTTLERAGFDEVTALLTRGESSHRGRVTLRAKYGEKPRSPFLYAGEQI